jgi:nucleotide-binding universal stress UspA family protein
LFGLAGKLLPTLQEEVRQHARERLAESQRQLDARLSVRTELREGDVWREILGATSAHRPDLVVLGTHGHTGMQHLLLGSVAEKAVRLSPVPVLTVRGT